MNGGTVVLFLAVVIAAVVMWKRRSRMAALGFAAVAVLPGMLLWSQLLDALSWPIVTALALAVGLVVWNRWVRSSSLVARWSARSRRKSGVASGVDLWRTRRIARRKAPTVRPSLAGLPRWRRWRMQTSEVGVRVCRTGLHTVWASVEDFQVMIGGPRKGKSGDLATQILEAPGAVLVTSTRIDTYQLTGRIREKTGPVVVFNAAGLAGIDSSIGFDPLTGCADPMIAAARAEDMIPAAGGDGGEREKWNEQARRVLAGLMYAASLGGYSMRDVLSWVARPGEASRQVAQILRQAGDPAFEQDVIQFFDTNDRTRSSITTTIMPALGWLTHAAAARAAAPGAGFDVEWMLRTRATVYLLGGMEPRIAPLLCALTGHVAREARRIAALQPSGRLDPPLRLTLDEAGLICPVPLDNWTSDMGGRGVTICAAFQGRAQMLDRYGPHGAATILNNAATVKVFGGTNDREDLQYWSTLVGDRDEHVDTTDQNGRIVSRSLRRVPVLQPAQIAGLPEQRVLVFRSGIPPVLGWAKMGWTRHDVRVQVRHDARIKRAGERTRPLLAPVAACTWAAERALAALAGRWPDRFGDAAGRRRDLNALHQRLEHDRHAPTPWKRARQRPDAPWLRPWPTALPPAPGGDEPDPRPAPVIRAVPPLPAVPPVLRPVSYPDVAEPDMPEHDGPDQPGHNDGSGDDGETGWRWSS